MNNDPIDLPTNREEYRGFFRGALMWRGSVTPRILTDLFFLALYALVLVLIDRFWKPMPDLYVTPFEYTGAVLGLVLVFRTNAGHERWWEARKLWGGIVNQSRNLMLMASAYGPNDRLWRESLTYWTVAFCCAAKESLRQSNRFDNLTDILEADAIEQLTAAPHMPMFAAGKISILLQQARFKEQIDGYVFLEMEGQRATLIDHLGGCERILKTPMPLVYAIKVRRFILLFLLLLPFSLIEEAGFYSVPIFLLVAYPLLSLDRIGLELQSPFDKKSLSHLPLDSICDTIKSHGLDLSRDQAQPKAFAPDQT